MSILTSALALTIPASCRFRFNLPVNRTTQASWGLSLEQQVQLAADAVIDMYCLGACDVFLAAAHRHVRE